MCGITGLLETGSQNRDNASLLEAMTAALASRGPDGRGHWHDPSAGVFLGHTRLSIVDTSSAGSQPMHAASSRFSLTYNGEIYNCNELRREIESDGHVFRGHSDTEVLLEAINKWGIESATARLNGIFAFAVWDHQQRSLTLCRDQLGVKPLYWGKAGTAWLFASELKAFRQHPDFQSTVDRNSIVDYLRFGYVPAPHTIYAAAYKLMPGTMVTLRSHTEPAHSKFWSSIDVAHNARANRFGGSDEQAIDRLESLLAKAVARQQMSDVPLGAFLSGGIDSSTVVAMMQQTASQPVRTFSIGFEDDQYNEAEHAADVARHLGTQHTELYVQPQHARDVIPSLADIYDEPFADSSQIPTYLVSKMTREHVTVALSGDGGDELFAGYNRYVWAERIWRNISWIPHAARSTIAKTVRSIPPHVYDRAAKPLGRRVPTQPGDKAHKLSHLLDLSNEDEIYRQLVSQWPDPSRLAINGHEHNGALQDPSIKQRFPNFTQRMQAIDLVTYLPDDILTKVDRASMAASLEARVPLLDPTIVEFAWSLPQHMKSRDGVSKWLLRQVLYRHVPPALIERPKMGFGVPIGDWIRGPIRDWAENLLSTESLNRAGLIRPEPVRQAWQEHLSGRRNWQHQLWVILMLQEWSERWV